MLPAASLAEQVTLVVPSGNTVPDALLQVTVKAAVDVVLGGDCRVGDGGAVRAGRLDGLVGRER